MRQVFWIQSFRRRLEKALTTYLVGWLVESEPKKWPTLKLKCQDCLGIQYREVSRVRESEIVEIYQVRPTHLLLEIPVDADFIMTMMGSKFVKRE